MALQGSLFGNKPAFGMPTTTTSSTGFFSGTSTGSGLFGKPATTFNFGLNSGTNFGMFVNWF